MPPTIRSIDRPLELPDLVGACHAFVSSAGRVVPRLRDRRLSDDPRERRSGESRVL
ncbi:DUF6192 family protein [Streptomyces sp. NPDC018019]|uniref:DUF6192 family protein n=1 Tax=Streptomyces sp. NPDC018019 TaxID=3365030 RepID=UPI003794CF28